LRLARQRRPGVYRTACGSRPVTRRPTLDLVLAGSAFPISGKIPSARKRITLSKRLQDRQARPRPMLRVRLMRQQAPTLHCRRALAYRLRHWAQRVSNRGARSAPSRRNVQARSVQSWLLVHSAAPRFPRLDSLLLPRLDSGQVGPGRQSGILRLRTVDHPVCRCRPKTHSGQWRRPRLLLTRGHLTLHGDITRAHTDIPRRKRSYEMEWRLRR